MFSKIDKTIVFLYRSTGVYVLTKLFIKAIMKHLSKTR